MDAVKADLHIHTVLSPCGDLDMSPGNIVDKAYANGLKIIGITDHNSTLHVPVVRRLAEKKGIFVLGGAEITTREEVHCLAFFPNDSALSEFQKFLDENQPNIPNNVEKFGHQPVVDENEQILEIIDKLLITGLNRSINDVEKEVHRLDGIFIPAHIDKTINSVFSQLGFLPPKLKVDALEISPFSSENETRKKFFIPESITIVTNSDAHFLNDIGKSFTLFQIEDINFQEIKMAIANVEGRRIIKK